MTALTASTEFYVSVATWLEQLSPKSVAQYYFTGYNSIISNIAMEFMVQDDFPAKEGEPETKTIQNLRTALAQLYAGSTCTLTRDGNRFTLALTVPEGTSDTWPSQIPAPGPITYPNRGRVTHG